METQRGAEAEVHALWERYRADHDPEVRERLILHYSPLVKYVAGRVAVGMPASVDHADLVSYGIFGLLDAIEKFDLTKGYKFETYAITRIRGAIIDELRSIDWVPRSVRSKARRLETAMQQLESRLHRSPTEEELAAELDLTVDELQQTLQKISLTSVAALDEVFDAGEGDRVSLVDTLQDLTTVAPDASFEDAETKQRLHEAITRLSDREQTVLGLYYFEGMTLGQVGDVLGVTESRICQIHTKAVLSLRAKLVDRAV
ncbi:RNA polymerase sigma factor WhiG [Egicoccus halophilus]|uniref:RNA polymerase sigma factor n=1 Tax=Egicoccus halophilus TaxID=1670830 RepID=A0A8J3AAP1_9ACTN|nr:RNA polymerase sigma factor WhiG [Egicoccus halophilus]GGI06498.1 RNA polymerase sigma factor WhiG [Egicoccus halophilus]